MKILRRFLAISAAAVVAMASGVLVANADATPTVYNTPGGQIKNGRLWNTTCEKYSSNVVRCRTDIWATTVKYVNGRYVQSTGWAFNNLSYLPAPRASWRFNNLGKNNPDWTSNLGHWRTECDTAVTGMGGCRSYMWVNVVKPLKSGGYMHTPEWVFNNVVLFSSSSIPGVTDVPAWIVDQSRLDVTGLTGTPLQIGAPMQDLATLGYFTYVEDEFPWYSSQALQNRGVGTSTSGDSIDNLRDVEIYAKGIRTVDGAHVGMTLGEIKAIYGNRLRLEVKEGHWDMYTAVVERDGHEMVFWSQPGKHDGRPMVDSDVINFIRARKTSPDLF